MLSGSSYSKRNQVEREHRHYLQQLRSKKVRHDHSGYQVPDGISSRYLLLLLHIVEMEGSADKSKGNARDVDVLENRIKHSPHRWP